MTYSHLNFTMSIRSLLFLIGFLFLFWLLARSWDKLQLILQNIHILTFIISIFISILGNFIVSALFQQLLVKYGVMTTYATVCQLFFFAQITKYIPGKIWVVWYQATLLKTVGSTSALIFTNLDLMGVLMLHTVVLTISLLILDDNSLLSILFFSIGWTFCWVVARYCALFQILQILLSKFKPIRSKLCECHANMRLSNLLLFYILFSITYLSSQLIMFSAVFNFSLDESIHYIAYLGLAWIAGVLSIIVPGGMGVKEFFFIFFAQLSDHSVSLDTLAAIAIISRFWLILQEILGVMIIFIWRQFLQKRDEQC
jgi:hypothetical protein